MADFVECCLCGAGESPGEVIVTGYNDKYATARYSACPLCDGRCKIPKELDAAYRLLDANHLAEFVNWVAITSEEYNKIAALRKEFVNER